MILVVGASGKIGRALSAKFLDDGLEVLGVDYGESPIQHANFNYFKLPREFDWNKAGINELLATELGFVKGAIDLVIFATRFREEINVNNEELLSETREKLIRHIDASMITPFLFSKYLNNHSMISNNSVLVFLGSTNGLEISQQSIGYGIANAALHRMYKQISVEIQIASFLILIGAILPLEEEDMARKDTLQDLYALINFLSEKKPRALVGEPIFLASGRLSLDATAVKLGIFNRLF